MLKSIDILIGLSVVMLVASMAVTVMTGFFTQLRNTRGRNLQQGIADLLRLIDPTFSKDVVMKLAEAVLHHPLIRDKEGRMGAVIHREELTKLLMELAAGTGPQQVEAEVQERLRASLAAHGITNPAQTLANVQAMAMQLEKSNSKLSNMARANIALLHEAEGPFVAKINMWFDQTMDRVSQRFTTNTRMVTFFCGLALAAVLQLDSIALVNRLSVDDELRASLTAQASAIEAKAQAGSADVYSDVINEGIITLPTYPRDFNRFLDLRHLTGMLFTTLLLSLGAPFWYGALQQLLQLRSKIAQDDDQQRQSRQTTQDGAQASSNTPAAGSVMAAGASTIPAGEQGDLAAVG